jgi:hypothetical protein
MRAKILFSTMTLTSSAFVVVTGDLFAGGPFTPAQFTNTECRQEFHSRTNDPGMGYAYYDQCMTRKKVRELHSAPPATGALFSITV